MLSRQLHPAVRRLVPESHDQDMADSLLDMELDPRTSDSRWMVICSAG
jgi:hypothetical protein